MLVSLDPDIEVVFLIKKSLVHDNLQSVDAKLLAADGDILSSQHGSVGGRLVTVGLDLHTTSNTGDGLAATGITQNVSLFWEPSQKK